MQSTTALRSPRFPPPSSPDRSPPVTTGVDLPEPKPQDLPPPVGPVQADTPDTGLGMPCDTPQDLSPGPQDGRVPDRLMERRNALMARAGALSARPPSPAEGDALALASASLRELKDQLDVIDQQLAQCLMPHDPVRPQLMDELASSASVLQASIRLFEMAGVEQRLKERGVHFQPGRLGVITHDPAAGPLPLETVLELVDLHAGDGSPAGTCVAARLLASVLDHHRGTPVEPARWPALKGCIDRLAHTLLPLLSGNDRSALLGTDSLIRCQAQLALDQVLLNPHLSSETCLFWVSGSRQACLAVMDRLLEASPWTPAMHELARFVCPAAGMDDLLPPWMDETASRVRARLGPAPSGGTAASQVALASAGLFDVFPQTQDLHRLRDAEQARGLALLRQRRT